MSADAFTIGCAAVLFDMDGVLVDTTPSVRRSWAAWAERRALDPEEVLRRAHGRPTAETVRELAPQVDAAAESAAIEAAQAADGEGVLAGAGAKRLLAQLPPRRWGVVTSATRALALARFAQVGLAIPDDLVTSDQVAAGKPDPECYLLAARRLAVEPQRCVVFEDAPAGIAAARAAGMKVLALTTTHTEEELTDADHVLPGMDAVSAAPRGEEIELRWSL